MFKKDLKRFVVKISLKDFEGFIIWYEYGMETLDRKILLFKNVDLLYKYSLSNKIFIEPDPVVIYKAKELEKFINFRKTDSKIRQDILKWWNLFIDLTCAISETYIQESDSSSEDFFRIERDISDKCYRDSKRAFKYSKNIYDKLFIGDWDYYNYEKKNIYKIKWNNSELRMLLRIIRYGLELFKKNIILINTEKDLEYLISKT